MIGARLLWHIPINIAQAATGFGAIWVFTRLLSPADYGLYALVLTTAQLAYTLSMTWAEGAAYRFLPAQKTDQDRADHFATLLALACGAAVLAGAATAVGLFWFADDRLLAGAIGYAAAFSFVRFITRLARETDRAELAVARYSILESAFLLLGFAFGIAFIMAFDMAALGPIAGAMAAGLCVALVDVPRMLKRAKGGAPSLARATAYASYGVPLALALGLELAVQTSTRGLIAYHLDEAAVGAFAAAFGLAGRTLDLVFIWAGAATGPLLLAAYEKDGRAGAERAGRDIALTFLLLAAPAALGVGLIARPLSEAMIGEGLRAPVAQLMPWLAAGALAQGFMTYYFSEAFQMARRTGLRAVLMIAPAALTIILCAILLPTVGLEGAAIATLAASCLGAVLLALVGRRFVRLSPPPGDALKILLCAAAMAGPVMAVPAFGGWTEVFAKAATGAVAYAIALLVLNPAKARSSAATAWRRVRTLRRWTKEAGEQN